MAYETLLPGRRAMLHAHIGEALEELHRERPTMSRRWPMLDRGGLVERLDARIAAS